MGKRLRLFRNITVVYRNNERYDRIKSFKPEGNFSEIYVQYIFSSYWNLVHVGAHWGRANILIFGKYINPSALIRSSSCIEYYCNP